MSYIRRMEVARYEPVPIRMVFDAIYLPMCRKAYPMEVYHMVIGLVWSSDDHPGVAHIVVRLCLN